MNHLPEEDLILHYYREDGGAAFAHLSECAECAAAFAALRADLDTIGPEDEPVRADGFETAMWRRLEPRLAGRTRRWIPWTGGLAIAASLVLAFWLGRQTSRRRRHAQVLTQEQVRERIPLVAVGDHLQRSVPLEVANAGRRDRRPVRVAAVRGGARLGCLPPGRSARSPRGRLDDLERVLVEIANSPQPTSGPQLARLRQRIESKGLLLKVRVIGSQVREKEKEARGARS
jgi:hypothetical protein